MLHKYIVEVFFMKLRRFFIGIVLLFIVVIFSACSGATSSPDKSPDNYAVEGDISDDSLGVNGSNDKNDDTEKTDDTGKTDGGSVVAAPSADKLVYTADLTVETKEYAKTMDSLSGFIKSYGGIIESQHETDNDPDWYRSSYHKNAGTLTCNIRVRVPSAKFNDFLSATGSLGKVISKNMNVENISTRYNDNEATIKALESQQESLLAMLKNATSISDMLEIQERLTRVETELNQAKTNRGTMDSQVAYSTIDITVREVAEFTKDSEENSTFWERFGDTVISSWSDFLFVGEKILFIFIRSIPFILLTGVIVFIIILPIRISMRKKMKHNNLGSVKQADKSVQSVDNEKENL